ncbi:MAG: cob(I)yrinic acid a,c-diamide adenosyltransferase [Candidatus Thermoplasmatota archaeon]|nr:cob(I)yrinic acid a,c-diamide adenosyltransferase [Candidatus Thermoplasmatota archaeon]
MYSGRGDKGMTDTSTGQRVSKSDQLMEWEGTLDELISQLGVSWSDCEFEDIRNDIYTVQRDLFALGEEILTEGQGRCLRADGVSWLEDKIKAYQKEIGEIKLFVIPGGSKTSSSLQLSRAVTRRAERRLIELKLSRKINDLIPQYMNRLSSFLFFIALASNKRNNFRERLWEWPNPERTTKKE